jgi:diguanylate cyclase (GGDEF)-like protein
LSISIFGGHIVAQRILVVEDDTNLRQVLKLQLEGAGYDVGAVEDGLKALEEVSHNIPDLILLDIMMPKMDGYEVCRRLKANFETSRIPVIMLTAKSTPIEKVEGFECGANDYVTKPYVTKELLARVKAVLQWSRTQRAASPLTGLPGNISIEQEATDRINSGVPFAYAVCDIDFFKSYNDRYGHHRGDEAIKMTASILLKAVEEKGTGKGFVGHFGGDDFVYLTSPDSAEAIGQQVIREFDQRVRFLYNEEDRKRGCLEVKNRRGEMEHFPLISLTIAVVMSDLYDIKHFAQLSDVASQLKTLGKAQLGSIVVFDRRTEQQKAPASKTGT